MEEKTDDTPTHHPNEVCGKEKRTVGRRMVVTTNGESNEGVVRKCMTCTLVLSPYTDALLQSAVEAFSGGDDFRCTMTTIMATAMKDDKNNSSRAHNKRKKTLDNLFFFLRVYVIVLILNGFLALWDHCC